jgi:hypothetical protein
LSGVISGSAAGCVGAVVALVLAPTVCFFGTLLAFSLHPGGSDAAQQFRIDFGLLGPLAAIVAAGLGGIASAGLGVFAGSQGMRAMKRKVGPGKSSSGISTTTVGLTFGLAAGLVAGVITAFAIGGFAPVSLLLIWLFAQLP